MKVNNQVVSPDYRIGKNKASYVSLTLLSVFCSAAASFHSLLRLLRHSRLDLFPGREQRLRVPHGPQARAARHRSASPHHTPGSYIFPLSLLQSSAVDPDPLVVRCCMISSDLDFGQNGEITSSTTRRYTKVNYSSDFSLVFNTIITKLSVF